MAISSSNTGGAWDNAKKYVEGGNLAILETDHYKDDKAIKAGANVNIKDSYGVTALSYGIFNGLCFNSILGFLFNVF